MGKHVFYLLLVCSLTLFSCDRSEISEGQEYFIFGKVNSGFCLQQCTVMFKIEEGDLFLDDISRYVSGENIVFNNNPLSFENYLEAQKLMDDLPNELFESPSKRFSCTGCQDQDVIVLIYFDGRETKEWLIDSIILLNPDFLQDYARQVLDVIELLNG